MPNAWVAELVQRNAAFAGAGFNHALKLLPTQKTMVVGCVDPRVDPADVLGLKHGEAAIVRNVGGRVTPDLFATLAMLRVVSKASGGDLGPGWNLVVLHHTDCGIKRIDRPDLLASFFGCTEEYLPSKAILDPHQSVVIDIAALRANAEVASGWTVTGLVYDVATGLVETVVAPSLLRA